jgi:hypothetical protein
MFQYVNIVLMVKQRYQHMKHLLSEAESTNEIYTSRCMYVEDITTNKSNKISLYATNYLENNRESHNVCTIHDLQIIYSELYDVMRANKEGYEVLILLHVISVLTCIVPTVYYGFLTIKTAIFQHDQFYLFFRGASTFCICAFKLLTFLWLTVCCHKTTEEVQDIFVCIQKLLIYPNSLGWNKRELQGFIFQLKHMKVAFSICGFFTLDLQFFCGSVSVIFTYILVLNQFIQGV